MFMGRPKRRQQARRATRGASQATDRQGLLPRFSQLSRPALLAGTALASTLAFGSPTPASAQAIIIGSNSSINFTRNSDCIAVGTCLTAFTIPFISPGASITLTNNGDLASIGIGASTIFATTFGNNNGPITITNNGDLATAALGSAGIYAYTGGNNSRIRITNNGDVATLGFLAHGLHGVTTGNSSRIRINNTGDLATLGFFASGIYGVTTGRGSRVRINNEGDIATLGYGAVGIFGRTTGRNSNVRITNDGDIGTRGIVADGIYAYTGGRNADVTIVNSGDVTTRGFLSDAIYAYTYGRGASVTIENSGNLDARGALAFGIDAVTTGPNSPIDIHNSGDVSGRTAGIYTYSATSTKITNSGSISARSGLAIDTEGASSSTYNMGLITGFVDLTGSADRFVNEAGGVFDAMERSYFGAGRDIFINKSGGTLRTAHMEAVNEDTRFVGLERFENRGLITTVDNRTGDRFRISNTPGGTDLTFVGSGDSTLALDTFLGGPGSPSDFFIVEGNTGGRTRLAVNNTNVGPGVLNTVGIPVIFVDGNVDRNDFFLEQPIDTGFFDYDLFFVPTGSGFFELRSHPGGGAHVLPHILEFSHTTFHNTTETWFDRSTDLRALLARGNACSDSTRRNLGNDEGYTACEQLYSITPGVWARGAGTWLELEDQAVTKANGRTFRFDLERELDIWQIETGVDFGKRDWLADGDALVFGVLGGAIKSTLNYTSLERIFEIEGMEVGAYATYLNGGLFVDTLFKTIFAEVDPKDIVGFPDTLDNTTYGFRTDAGYRFGDLQQGAFIEPLATIAASWTHIDDFQLGGNAVDFDDDENVRGRVGLRVGTSTEVWEGTTMEPFVVGSLWGTLSGSHSATLTSGGTTFQFTDDPEDVWGEISGGVNFFNPSAQTSVFAKVNYIFADDAQGIGLRGGMRYNW